MTAPTIWLCSCCTDHGGGRVLWERVTCPECGLPCSCEGCVADADLCAPTEPEAMA